MTAAELHIGQYYIIVPNEHGMRVCDRPVKYCGVETFQGETYHDFFDDVFRLHHWIKPERVIPYEPEPQPTTRGKK